MDDLTRSLVNNALYGLHIQFWFLAKKANKQNLKQAITKVTEGNYPSWNKQIGLYRLFMVYNSL